MSLVFNSNYMQLNSANSDAKLATSEERMSSGLRINSADDAAGLANRKMMRAEIGASGQGRLNANDVNTSTKTTDDTLGSLTGELKGSWVELCGVESMMDESSKLGINRKAENCYQAQGIETPRGNYLTVPYHFSSSVVRLLNYLIEAIKKTFHPQI